MEDFTLKEKENENYIIRIFAMLKKLEKLSVIKKEAALNHTELRLVGEILYSKAEGERLISTQLAKRLNVTRSAVSQIVQNLEKREIIKRVDDLVDKKIAYVELTDFAMKLYLKTKESWLETLAKIIEEFGKEKLDALLALSDEFGEIVEKLNG